MSRLLFAAARGARIQINGFTATVPSWYDSHKWSSMHESVLRIHPDDEHLQYGPISTAVRTDAFNGAQRYSVVYDTLCGTWGISLGDWYQFRDCESEPHRSLFLLILAEALADEGL